MIDIPPKTIAKSTDRIIKNVEKELKDSGEVYIDKKINDRVEHEISHLGKEKLIADHVYDLTKKFNKSHKNKILFLLVKLYNFNKQIHESLRLELKNDKNLLNNRIKSNVEKNKVYKEFYTKLLKKANQHYAIVKKTAKDIDPKKKYSRIFVLNIVYHEKKAKALYKILINLRTRKTLHKVLLAKLDKVYQSLIESTVDLSKRIVMMVKYVKNNKVANVRKSTNSIHSIVSNKIGVLRNFAYKYSYNIIHSDNFLDFNGNKIVLVTKKV